MSTFIYVLVIICVVLSYLTMSIYYLWISVIAFFPRMQHCKEIPYTSDIDMNFFIVIPCLNEETVIVEAVQNVLNAHMKGTRVIVIDDDSTDNTVKNLQTAYAGNIVTVENDGVFAGDYAGKELILLQKRLPEAQQGKGRSLNCAYKLISKMIENEGLEPDNCVMSVLDADSFVGRRVLERAAVILSTEKNVGMVQARLRIGTFTRDYFLPLFQDIEFFVYINNMQNVREYTGTVSAAGNGQFNRFSAIDPEQPWTECLLEDYDFSLRLLLKGWRTRLLQEDRVFQQGVLTFKKFVMQRSRWCQGGLQCLHYWKDIRRSRFLSSYGKFESIYFMLLPTITLLSVFTQLLSWIIIFYYYWTRSSILESLMAPFSLWELWTVLGLLLFFVFFPGIIYGAFYHADTREDWTTCMLAGIFQPVYNLMQIPAVMKAVWRHLTHQNSWIKTQHFDEKKTKRSAQREAKRKQTETGAIHAE